MQGYAFNGDAMEMFEQFFGATNPEVIALDETGKQVKLLEKIEKDFHKDAVTERSEIYAKDLQIKCSCTLEEFFEGSTKTLHFTRLVLLGDGQATEREHVQKEIVIKPGMKAGMQMKFVGEGNRTADKLAGDLVVTISELPHQTIRRVGDDLIYRHKITLADALTIAVVEFKTLDGEIIKFRPDELITPEYERVFPGKGMPVYNDDPLSPLLMNHDRGNFVLKFQIEFPKKLS